MQNLFSRRCRSALWDKLRLHEHFFFGWAFLHFHCSRTTECTNAALDVLKWTTGLFFCFFVFLAAVLNAGLNMTLVWHQNEEWARCAEKQRVSSQWQRRAIHIRTIQIDPPPPTSLFHHQQGLYALPDFNASLLCPEMTAKKGPNR